MSGTLADTTRGREVYALMKMAPRPAIDGLSIGYVAKQWEPAATPGLPRRRLTRLDLIEISPVTFPANARARVDQVKGTVEREAMETLAALPRVATPSGLRQKNRCPFPWFKSLYNIR